MKLIVHGGESRLAGELDIPVSKYHAHRALMLASLAPGTSRIRGLSSTRQIEWTVSVLRALGTDIRVDGDDYLVTGGPYRLDPEVSERGSSGAQGVLDVGSSGTTLYFVTGLASLADRPVTVTGMKYFRRRPIKALLDALRQLGVQLAAVDDCPPIVVRSVRPTGGEATIPGTLSQWLSGLLLLAPFASGDSTIRVTGDRLNERPYVDLTVRMMRHFGLEVEASDDGMVYRVPGRQTAKPADYVLPPDIGSAAFGLAAAALHPADVLFRGLPTTRSSETDHPEADFLDIASEMGLPMALDPATGFVRVRHDGVRLRGLDLDCRSIPDLLPVLSAMANFAEGTTRLRNVGHIRLKESDRVAAMLQLGRLGGRAEQSSTELRITGVEEARPAALSSFNDHRVLMALAVAATRAPGESTLTYPHAYRISYPAFLDAMNAIGLDLDVGDGGAAAARAGAEPETATPPRGVPVVPGAEPLVLTEAVRRLAAERPEEPAVFETGAREPAVTSWSELQREADRVSALLLDLGVRRGEPVAVQLPNWREFVAIALGIAQIGAVVTPIMPVFRAREVTMTLSRSRARVLFLPNHFRGRRPAAELLDVADEARSQSRRLALEHVVVLQAENRHHESTATELPPVPPEALASPDAAQWTWRYYETALAAVAPDERELASRAPGPDDFCQLLFTSGTTGEPKGVRHTHRSLGLATAMEVAHLGLTGADRVFIPSPLAHQTGFLYGMLLAWRLGAPAVLQPVWDAATALDQAFGRARASFVQAATPFLTDLVAAVQDGAPAPESLRIFVATGAAVPRELAGRATRVLGASVLGAFGTTETCLATLSAPDDPPESAWGSDGRALPGVEVRIVDDDGHPVPAGVEGNFELRSHTVFDGYLDRPDLTEDVFTADGWYRTGDLALLDAGGFLHVTGRVKDIVNRGGEKVPVVEVENVLYRHPLIADIAIVAMPDPRLGERACAFVVPARDGSRLAFEELKSYLKRAGVSQYYWPERLEFLDELPRNAVGKVQKNVLRERAAALAAATRDGRRKEAR